MNTLAVVSLITGTGVAGDGSSKSFTLVPQSVETIIRSIGAHNITQKPLDDDLITVVLRGWQTREDRTLPNQEQIDFVQKVIDQEQAKLDEIYTATLAETLDDAEKRLGSLLVVALGDTIRAGIKPAVLITITENNNWLEASTENPLILDAIEKSTKLRKKT